MRQLKIPAVFMRGGTSKAVMFQEQHLPQDHALWDEIFLTALGSPDPYGRQLDGMGGGLSSVSKVCVVGPSSRPDADVDYNFAQVLVKDAKVDYTTACGNMSSAIGPFAVDEGMVKVAANGEALVRIFNTNTKKIIHARFQVADAMAAVDGNLTIPGVAGTGSPVKLEFRDPGGATTGKLLPTGNVVDTLDVPGVGKIRCSMVDATNACVFLNASDLGIKGTELPEAMEQNAELMRKLAAIRASAAVAMGIAPSIEDAIKQSRSVPFIGFVSAPQDAATLSGAPIDGTKVDLTARMLSNGQPHRALPLSCTLCMAVASRIEGTTVYEATRAGSSPDAELRIAMPSGVLTAAATVRREKGQWHAEQGAFYRTQRRLFEGSVLLRASTVPGLLAMHGGARRAA